MQGVQTEGNGNTQFNDFRQLHVHAAAEVEWPIQVGQPPSEAVALQPRRILVDRLLAYPQESIALVQLVTGDGGVGKSQLAAAVFRWACEDNLDLRIWITASSRTSIVDGLAQLAIRLGRDQPGDADASAAAARDFLATTDRRWLLVFDDLSDPSDLHQLKPHGPAGRVLITTRRQDLQLPHVTPVKVGVFSPEESLAYLCEKLADTTTVQPTVLEQAAELAEDLGHLPLALAQASAVIAAEADSTCALYRERLADRTASLEALFPAEARADDYPQTVRSTWALALEQANKLQPVGVAGRLMELAATLDPNGIPSQLFTAPPALGYLSASTSITVSEDDARRARGHLERFSLLSRASGLIRVHALNQRAMLEELVQEARIADPLCAAALALLAIWPQVERDQTYIATLRLNAAGLASTDYATIVADPSANTILFKLADSLASSGQLSRAIALGTKLRDQCSQILGSDHPDTLSSRSNLASWQARAGDLTGATEQFEQLLTDETRVLGPDHPATLTTRNNLASWQAEAGDLTGAIEQFERLLTDRTRVLGPDHPATLTVRSNLASWQAEAGDLTGAIEQFERLLTDQTRVLGPDHPATLTTRSNLASSQARAGGLTGAIEQFEQLLTDQTRVLGPDHPDTLSTRNNLASWQADAGDLTGAIEQFERLLTDRSRVLGPDHPATLTTRNNLAHWQARAGNLTGAIKQFEQLLTDQTRALGPDHPNTLTTRNNLAYWQGKQD